MTLKEIETQLLKEHKSGYVVIELSPTMAKRTIRIGYFKDIARYHGLSYDNTEVKFIKYKGWEI